MSGMRVNPIVEDEMRASLLINQYKNHKREMIHIIKKMNKIKNLDKIDQLLANNIKEIIEKHEKK